MERGEYPAQVFMQEIRKMVTEMVAQISASTMELKIDDSNPDQLICPKCKLAGRSGLLHERNTDKGTFVVCSNGKEACGFISEAPKNKLQKKALIEAKCPNCKGLMRLRLPRDRNQAAVMLCLNYAECKGHLRFDNKGALVEVQRKLSAKMRDSEIAKRLWLPCKKNIREATSNECRKINSGFEAGTRAI